MHVCEVIKSLAVVGGAEVLLAERLSAAPVGKRYTVVCMQSGPTVVLERLRAKGVTIVDLTACPRPLRLARLLRVVRRLRPDVLNIHSPLPAAVLRPVSRLWRHRPMLVSTVHSVRFRLPTLLLDRATGWLDARTVAVGPQVARSVTTWGARNLSTRVHGVDVAGQRRWAAQAAAIRKEWDVPEDAFLIVHVGNFRPVKNQGFLVDVAARLAGTEPRALFLLAGSGPLSDHIARRVADLRLENVRLVGPVPLAARLIACADLLVLCSTYEGLPVVIMEALAAGVPVVSTDVGGVADLVEPGRNGLLVPPGSTDAFAEAIRHAMRPDSHARLREGALSTGCADIADTADWFDKLYESSRARDGAARR
ncbi:glycosyltransferase [Sphaerisporangium fuscum]|uniref:glycosyltransferase n=1 Tax=Sphaerisporangium fuscum TaxID=2835868 RepID=UPI002029AB22|nr:glycosyltransferase [Sphaerisporangium fuscum]